MAYYGCNVKDEEVKERVQRLVNIISEVMGKVDKGELLLDVLNFYIKNKPINLDNI